MNIVARSDLNFQGKAIVPVAGMTGIWLTSAEIANALQYKSAKSVTNLFNQNSDEFTSGMTQVIESVTSGNYRKKVRVFSLRGAHLIAMFARTTVAKEFRRWVLDILDREVANGNQPETLQRIYTMNLTDSEMCSIAWLYKSAMHMREELDVLVPKLEALQSPLANSANSLAKGYVGSLEVVREIMAREVQQISQADLVNNLNWGRVLPDLKIH